MTPDRWRQITEIFHAARERDAAERAVFLAEACRDDSSLRKEVEAMLIGHDQARAIEEPQVVPEVSTFEQGDVLGPYRIERLIGAGGMGEVYKAHDSRLNRSVAVKVLSSPTRTERHLQERFAREAKTL